MGLPQAGFCIVPRDEFPGAIRRAVSQRVELRCSSPTCGKPTSGPADDPERSVSIGVAAHITAASPGGPRYDASLTPEQRSSITNAIWLCQNCAALIDRDIARFTAPKLRDWKERAERAASLQLAAGSDFRAIAPSEVVEGLNRRSGG